MKCKIKNTVTKVHYPVKQYFTKYKNTSLNKQLILTEDDLFNASVHDSMVKGIDWYTERILGEISLGGLFILVVIRTIQHNMLKMRVGSAFSTKVPFSKGF